MANILAGSGLQMQNGTDVASQTSPLLRYYSPRLFGAPPQLTNQCDMRSMSSDGTNPGPVGDFYLTKILQDANIANFVVGRARFMGGMSSLANVIRECFYYMRAMKQYNIFDSGGSAVEAGSVRNMSGVDETSYKTAYGERDNKDAELTKDDNDSLILSALEGVELLSNFEVFGSALVASLKTSLSVQQPFYTFEDDWSSYINNVKMIINSAVIMLGLQQACVRIGDDYIPLGMYVEETDANDVWSNYRFITPTTGLGDVTAINTSTGDTSQYVSFMIDPVSISETYTNSIGPSQIYSSVLNAGSSVGAEIAFITNSTAATSSDKTIKLGQDAKEAADTVLKNLSSGNGRFTAALASSMARSFVGDHTIYPDVFQSHTSTSSMSITCHLTSDSGDPYGYLTNIVVPLAFILSMGLPMLSKNNASAYNYPPVIQCNIPGMWGTRLGMIESLTFNKNPNGKDVSINGYPLQVDVTISVRDLQHVLVTSPMNNPSVFLNNTTMFDYIAQMCGVDKYRVNGSMRTITKLALAASACNPKNMIHNVSDALMNDWHSLCNRITGYGKYQ